MVAGPVFDRHFMEYLGDLLVVSTDIYISIYPWYLDWYSGHILVIFSSDTLFFFWTLGLGSGTY